MVDVTAVDVYIDEIWEDLVQDIDALVRVRSVENLDEARPGAPWGEGSLQALETALNIAHKLGLTPHNCEGYIGYADLQGQSDTQIATIAHCDIVPEGLGWTFEPLRVSRHEGYLVGRGVQDDKGPLILSLYAAHFFACLVEKTGQKLPYTLRCLVGACEETTMADVEWYLSHFPAPAFCFTPDAEFPLICGEKGVFHASVRTKAPFDTITELDGGTVANAIPGLATALVRADIEVLQKALDEQKTSEIELQEEDGQVRIIAHGRGGHASMPEGTLNAIGLLVDFLLAHVEISDAERRFLEFEAQLFASTDGSSLQLDTRDDIFGPLTLIGGTIRTEDGLFVQSIDSRYPTSITSQAIITRLTEIAESYGCTFELLGDKEPFYIEPTSPEISTLLATYEEFSGKRGEALVIGGGTYARNFPRACAFGPYDPELEVPEWVGMEHGPDEAIAEDQLKLALKIYIVSIGRLMELDL